MPDITSYDYDAPMDEAGNPTEKVAAFKEIIKNVRDLINIFFH
jgi:beta-galactosidase